MKVHFVSQVLLRRFTVDDVLSVHSKHFSPSIIHKPQEVTYAELPTNIFAPIEKKYSYTETRTATAFDALDQGVLLNTTKEKKSITKLMVLHFTSDKINCSLY